MTMRVPDWEARLLALIETWSARPPMVWGQTDCACFARADVYAMRGDDAPDPFADLPPWHDELSADAAIAAAGGLAHAMAQRFEEIAPAFARRGDLGIAITPLGPALLVVEGDMIVAPGVNGGLARLKRAHLRSAYRI